VPLKIQDDGPVLGIAYRQPLKSWFLINNFVAPPIYGFLCFLYRHARTPFWSVLFGIYFLLSVYFLLDRFFGRTVLESSDGELRILYSFFLWKRRRSFKLMEMWEPYVTQEEWYQLGLIQKIPWPVETPSRMRFKYQQKKTIRCCRRLTEAELWEILSAIRKRNPRADHKWSREPLPAPAHTGPLDI
jgi:hypothetical protein